MIIFIYLFLLLFIFKYLYTYICAIRYITFLEERRQGAAMNLGLIMAVIVVKMKLCPSPMDGLDMLQ